MVKKPMKFEEAFSRLEKVIEELEAGELTLDETLKKYEEGMAMLRICREILQKAEKKIEVLTRDEEGKLRASPADIEGTSEGE